MNFMFSELILEINANINAFNAWHCAPEVYSSCYGNGDVDYHLMVCPFFGWRCIASRGFPELYGFSTHFRVKIARICNHKKKTPISLGIICSDCTAHMHRLHPAFFCCKNAGHPKSHDTIGSAMPSS